MNLITAETRALNPWSLNEGDRCFQILIDLDTVYHDGRHAKYSGKVSVPATEASNLEEAATIAFGIAQRDGMDSPMMLYCAFYVYDEEETGWAQFL